MDKEQFEEILEHIELAVNECWDDVEYLRGGDLRESIKGQYYTTFEYWHNNKRFDVHVNNNSISVYKNGLSDNTRIHKLQISESWYQEFKEFLATI